MVKILDQSFNALTKFKFVDWERHPFILHHLLIHNPQSITQPLQGGRTCNSGGCYYNSEFIRLWRGCTLLVQRRGVDPQRSIRFQWSDPALNQC